MNTDGTSFPFFPEVLFPVTQSNISRRVDDLDPDPLESDPLDLEFYGSSGSDNEGIELAGLGRHVN